MIHFHYIMEHLKLYIGDFIDHTSKPEIKVYSCEFHYFFCDMLMHCIIGTWPPTPPPSQWTSQIREITPAYHNQVMIRPDKTANTGEGGILKYCPRVLKLRIWLLRGWGRCLKVTLQTCAPENFRLCRWGDKRTRQACADGDPHWRERNLAFIFKHHSKPS